MPPPRVVRHDGDDAYLVVAADKGTATFSDIANAISAEYGFWLGDAFASGGSAGYDHKKMAITARGAWECVKRHFREMGVDIQTPGFHGRRDRRHGGRRVRQRHAAVAGTSGCSRPSIISTSSSIRIRIRRARYRERERLFALPRSSWEDYSQRGASPRAAAIYSRSAKSLTLSREAQALLELPAQATPNEVDQGHPEDCTSTCCGTAASAPTSRRAAKATATSATAATMPCASTPAMLNCKVVGEGGNLGFSQLGRIEYARRGGRLNTDFIDNSAGVNCSDVEVNLKILLNGAVRAARDSRAPARDRLLVQMTDEVAALVLRNNYLQSQAISTSEFHAKERLSENASVIRALERSGDLNRALEFLPSEEEIAERRKAGEGLTRPELAILL